MNTLDRNRLLMEASGINCYKVVQQLSVSLKNSPVYIESMIKLQQASLTYLPSLMYEYASLRDLDFAVTNMMDYASLETHVFEYAIHSFVNWWVNPFEKEQPKDCPLSIGQLLIDYKGEILTIDELIVNNDISDEDKIEIVSKRIDGWHKDQVFRMTNVIDEVKSRDRRAGGLRFIESFLSVLLLLFSNFFSLYLFSNGLMREFLISPDWSYLSTYALFIPIVGTLIYDILFATIFSIKSRRDSGFDYVLNFSKNKSVQLLNKIDKLAGNLMSYLVEHIKDKMILDKDSINRFVFEESTKIKSMLKITRQKNHRILDTLFSSISWVFFFLVVFSFIVVIIDMQKGIAI